MIGALANGKKLRMAGQLLQKLLVPKTAAGTIDKTQLALRYAPDILYSGLTSGMLPPGATAGERVGAGAEDLAISLLGSVIGQGAGAGIARGMGKKLGSNAGNLAVTLGDVAGQGSMEFLAPRPILDGAYDRIYSDQQATEAEVVQGQQEVREEQMNQELMNLLLNAGYYGGRIV